ncbi:MAG: indole-3-glycerol phosphate synthase TrpC [bacterium]|nr:indole-3-glycerol phosphate synthase TrpC [bacterium]
MILEEIAERTRERIAQCKKELPLEKLKEQAERLPKDTGFPFAKALRGKELRFICEVKKASPSKGLIAESFPYKKIAQEYEQAGAAAVSVLTEPFYFQGSNEYLREIAQTVTIPVLRKDFTVDEYMIYEAKILGASAVLLICAILNDDELNRYHALAASLGLSALVEVHDEEEARRALRAGARIVGVNNRNLKDFTVDISNSLRIRPMIPPDVIFVSESGMKTPADIQALRDNGTDAVLIGETLMRSPDKAEALARLRAGV